MIDPTACKVVSVVATFAWLWDMVTSKAWLFRGVYIDADENPTLYNIIVWAKVAVALGAVVVWWFVKK